MADKKPKYVHTAANLHETGQGWRAATYVVTVVALGLLFLVAKLEGAETVVLVPAGFSSHAMGRVAVQRRTGTYLGLLARSDVASLLDWTPQTVGSQFSAFLGRCTPALYARLNPQMLADAKSYQSYNLSEVFYIRKVAFSAPSTINITGWLDRYSGSRLVMHALLTYRLAYNSAFSVKKLEVVKHGT